MHPAGLKDRPLLQTPRARDVGLFRRVLGGLSCREYEAAAARSCAPVCEQVV